mmetsp:Transcript_5681/g.16424  ORF Transcript_5681/g.16424 Transcript_5681/m.16424 type:complete len:768 (-) Transcript_5681:34-2337(-)
MHRNTKSNSPPIRSKQAKRDLEVFTRLPGSEVIPTAAQVLQSKRGRTPSSPCQASTKNRLSNASGRDPRFRMTAIERQRLDELARECVVKRSDGRRGGAPSHAPGATAAKAKRGSRRMDLLRMDEDKLDGGLSGGDNLSPYRSANAKIGRVLRQKRPVRRRDEMKSHLLEKYFAINRNETEAAVTLQSFWRRTLSIRRMRLLALWHQSVLTIQSAVRSYLSRLRTSRWLAACCRAIIFCQRRVRKKNAMRRWRWNGAVERRASIKCQSGARVFLSKVDATRRRRAWAATVVQSHWRGAVARQLRVHLWRTKNATLLQTRMRMVVSSSAMNALRRSKHGAALRIERCWRGYRSRKIRDEMLHDRDVETREDQVRMLGSERTYWSDRAGTLEARLARNSSGSDDGGGAQVSQWREDIESLPSRIRQLDKHIEEGEVTIAEQCRLRMRMSPRSVEQGWRDQIDINVVNTRRDLTEAKLEVVFGARRRLREGEEGLRRKAEEIVEARDCARWWGQWYDEEMEDLWDCQRKHHLRDKDLELRRKVADVRRRWKIPYRVPSGKPDKARLRRERGEEINDVPHRGFCGGTVDLLAPDGDKREEAIQEASAGARRANDMMGVVKLLSHEGQVQQFEHLMKPVVKVMNMRNVASETSPPRPETPSSQCATNFPGQSSQHIKEAALYPNGSLRTCRQRRQKAPEAGGIGGGGSRVPWSLLDKLQSERDKFEEEKATDSRRGYSRWWKSGGDKYNGHRHNGYEAEESEARTDCKGWVG